MLHQAHGRRHIKKSSRANSRIDDETQTILESLAYLTLQKIVKNNVWVGKIVIEISDRTLQGIGHIFYINISNRRQKFRSTDIGKIIKFTIGFLVGIDRIYA